MSQIVSGSEHLEVTFSSKDCGHIPLTEFSPASNIGATSIADEGSGGRIDEAEDELWEF